MIKNEHVLFYQKCILGCGRLKGHKIHVIKKKINETDMKVRKIGSICEKKNQDSVAKPGLDHDIGMLYKIMLFVVNIVFMVLLFKRKQ